MATTTRAEAFDHLRFHAVRAHGKVEHRTDAWKTSWLAVQDTVTIAVGLYMPGKTFIVCATCWSGLSIDRPMHIRPPAWGVRAVGESQKVRLGQLPQILQGAYGHTEASRLWYQHVNS